MTQQSSDTTWSPNGPERLESSPLPSEPSSTTPTTGSSYETESTATTPLCSDTCPHGAWANSWTTTVSPTCAAQSQAYYLSPNLSSTPNSAKGPGLRKCSNLTAFKRTRQPHNEPIRPGFVAISRWAQARNVRSSTAKKWAETGQLPGAYLKGKFWHVPQSLPIPTVILHGHPDHPNFLPLKTYAKLKRIQPYLVRMWLAEGKLTGVKVGGHWFVDPDAHVTRSRLLAARVASDGTKAVRPGPLLMTISDVSRRTGIAGPTLRNWIKKEELPAILAAGGRYLIDLRKALREHRDAAVRSQLVACAESGALGVAAQRLVGSVPDDEVW